MRVRVVILFLTILLTGIGILLFACTGFNAVYVLAITLMTAGFGFLFFRVRIAVALLVSSTIMLLIVNGLKQTITGYGSIMENNVIFGSLSFPVGYLVIIGLIIIISRILIRSIRNNRD
jgi:hypothetical protein